jgi:hypothetical protein
MVSVKVEVTGSRCKVRGRRYCTTDTLGTHVGAFRPDGHLDFTVMQLATQLPQDAWNQAYCRETTRHEEEAEIAAY